MILEIRLSVSSGLSHVSVTAIRSAFLSLTNYRKEADLFLIDLTLRRQPLRDLEPGPGLRLISELGAMMSMDLHSGNYASLFDSGGPRWQSGNTLASHLCGRGSIPVMAVSGKAGSCLPLVGSLQYTTLANSMYWFPLPFQLPVVI